MSIKKVAAMAGVSIATVSRCFSHPELLKKETLEKVERASEQLNYRPNSLAQNFRRGRSGIIVVVLDRIGDPLYETFTQTIAKVAQTKGYEILIKETNQKVLSLKCYRDILGSKQADGLLVLVDPPKMTPKNQSLFDDLPIIFVKGERDVSTSRHIELDNFEAARKATQYLIGLGHRHIAYITPSTNNSTYRNRLAGFVEAINDAYNTPALSTCLASTGQSAQEAAMSLLAHSPSTSAIFCANDDIAIDVLAHLKRENIRIPEDLSLMGFNNIRYSANTCPPLTTVEYPLDSVAKLAMENLCTIIDKPLQKEKGIETKEFFPQLVIRSSTSEI